MTTFARHAAGYDDPRRRLIPPFDAFYGTAVDALGLAARPPRRVLDLGAGTGLLSRGRARRPPRRPRDAARRRRAHARPGPRPRWARAPRYVVADLGDPLPAGPWDAVVSALAIHHLEDAGKRALFERIHDALAPGGVFVNAEQVAGPTAFLDAHLRAWHERRSRALGTTDDEWAASLQRQAHDRCASVEAPGDLAAGARASATPTASSATTASPCSSPGARRTRPSLPRASSTRP